MGIQQITKTAEILIAQGVKKSNYIAPVCRVGSAEKLGLNLKELITDTVQFNQRNSEFVPLETMKNAVKYAKEVLGIKKFSMSNLGMANYTLQGLSRIKALTGTDIGITKVISKKVLIDPITKIPNSNITGMINAEKGVLTLCEDAMIRDFSEKIGRLAQMDNKNIKEYLKLLENLENGDVPLCEIMQRLKKLNFKPANIYDLPNQTVSHELWHRLHFLNCKKQGIDYYKLGKAEELIADNIKDTRFLDEFKSPEIQKIISDYKFLGNYAKASPCEFVAEVGSILGNGIEPPQKIMELYYKYGGPRINLQLLK